MQRQALVGRLIAGLVAALPTMTLAQEMAVTIGKQEYMAACASCHGEDAKGNGPLADLLDIETPDLSMITQRMGTDMFPMWNTVVLIDGRSGVRAHGGEMPVWGDRFNVDARRPDNPSASAEGMMPRTQELLTLGRIMAISYYLESIQQ